MIRPLTTPEIERTRAAIRACRSPFAAGSSLSRHEAAGGSSPLATGGTLVADLTPSHEAQF